MTIWSPSCLLFRRNKSMSMANNLRIKTFVFLDSETTGLPSTENNRTKITELCLNAVSSDHLMLGVFPRVQNKLILCFNPCKMVQPMATEITGLSNDLLEHQSAFTKDTVNLLNTFLDLHQKPICFVAHNGSRFDYPILRTHIHNLGCQLSDDILCIDSLQTFRELHNKEQADINGKATHSGKVMTKSNFKGDNQENDELSQQYYIPNVSKVEKSQIQSENQNSPVEFDDGFDSILTQVLEETEQMFDGNQKGISSQEINETTPRRKTVKCKNYNNSYRGTHEQINGGRNIKKQLNFGVSFKLSDVYSRLTKKEPTDAHRAEQDVSMLMECASTLGESFVNWSNLNAKRFNDVPLMRPGTRI